MPRIGRKGCKPISARGYASAGIQHRIYIKREDVPRWNVVRERSGYTKSPDFIHWLIEVAEQHLRIKSEYQAESKAGDDSHTSDESEESGEGEDDEDDEDEDDDDDDDDDGDDEEDDNQDNIPDVKDTPPDAPMDVTPSQTDDASQKLVKEEEEQTIGDEGPKVHCRRGYTAVAIKDVAPIICFDVNAPRQLRPRLKLKLKPLKQEAPVEKPKRGRRKSQIRHLKKPRLKKESEGYSCKKCCRIFGDRPALRHHQIVHAVDDLTCRDCQMTFNSKSAMWVHRKVQHSAKTLACEHCDLKFSRKYQLKEHMRGHKGVKPFACPTCNKKFRTTAHLSSHMDLHSNFRRYLCDLCGLTFHRRDLLSRHIIKHSQPKTYTCEECGKVFAYKVTLQDHLIRHQNVKAGKTPYKCQTCLKEFFTPKSYQHHMGRHRGEKVFACDQCDKKFKQKFYLDRHKIIHREEKPFTCSNCGRGFTQHSNMAIHMRTHTGEKPYQCDLCEKAFAHNVSLKTHKKTAHGIDLWQHDKTKPIVALGRPKGDSKKKSPPKIRLKSRAVAAEMQIQSDLYQAAVEFARERLAPLAFPAIPAIPAIHGSPGEQMSSPHSPSESEEETPSPGSSTIDNHPSTGIKAVLDHRSVHNHQQVHDRQQAHECHLTRDHQPTPDHLSESNVARDQNLNHDHQPSHKIHPPHDNHQDFRHHPNPDIHKQISSVPQQYQDHTQPQQEMNEQLTRGSHQFHDHEQPNRDVREQLTPIPQAYPEHSTVEQQNAAVAAAASRSQTPNSSINSSIEQPFAHIIHNPVMHSVGEHPLRLDKPSSPFSHILHSPNAHSEYPSRHEKVEQWHHRNSEALSWMSRGVSHAQLMQGLRAVTPNMMHPVTQALGMLNPEAQEHVNLVGGYAHSAYIQRSNSTGSQPMQPPSWRS